MEGLNEKLDQYKVPIGLSLIGLVLIIGGTISSGLLKKPKEFPKESIVRESSNYIKVDISGAVQRPGVYALSSSSRVEDLIKKAGGFVASASGEYISKSLNLSQKISDGQKFYIPFSGEPFDFAQGRSVVAGVSTAGKIGINSGTQVQLESLPGVGPATATKIMNARPYTDVNELITKKAVSKSVFTKIKDLVDLN